MSFANKVEDYLRQQAAQTGPQTERAAAALTLARRISDHLTILPDMPLSAANVDTLLAQRDTLHEAFQNPETALEIASYIGDIYSLQRESTSDEKRLGMFWAEFLVKEIPTITRHMESGDYAEPLVLAHWNRLYQDVFNHITSEETATFAIKRLEQENDIIAFITDNVLRMTEMTSQNPSEHFRIREFTMNFILGYAKGGNYVYERIMKSRLSDNQTVKRQGAMLAILALDHYHKTFATERQDALYTKYYDAVQQNLLAYGLDLTELLPIWDYHAKKQGRYTVDTRSTINLLTIESLESQRPGICKVLREEFGIRNFSRYPMESLIRQYDERNETDLEYGLSIAAIDDHNDALQYLSGVRVENNLLEHSPHPVRFIEVGGKIDLAKRMLQMSRRYKPKMQFVILEAHGSPTGITLDKKEGSNYRITPEDLLSMGARRLGQLLDEDATIILASCSTGKKHPRIANVEQAMSILGFEVIAPDDNSYIRDISVTFYNGKLHFTVHYEGEDRNQVNAVRYKNGRELLSEEATRRLLPRSLPMESWQ